MTNMKVEQLTRGETVVSREPGNSMTPILKSCQAVELTPISKVEKINIGDIVYCKVRGSFYTHKVHAVGDRGYLIGNNHGHMNGWTPLSKIYGKVTKIYEN